MQQEVNQEKQKAEKIQHRIKDRAHYLTFEKEKHILNGFDVILQQLDNITHDLDIKESTTAKH